MGTTVRNLSVGYQKPSLTGVHFTLQKGEILCVLGRNESGKTTLFKTLLGLLSKHAGETLIDDVPLDSQNPKHPVQKIAHIPQARKIDFALTTFEVVLFERTPHLHYFGFPTEKGKAVVVEMMQQIDIWHLKDKAFSQTSGGEQQLITIARALTQQPTYIVMDGPTSALDFGNQLKMLQRVKTLQSQDIGIIFSTHDPDHVFLCDSKVVAVEDHIIAALGTPDEVMTEILPKDLYEVETKIINQKNRKICFPS